MRASHVLETCLYAEDLAAAEDFYAHVLGLKPFARVPGRHVFFRCDDAVFLVFNPAATEKPFEQLPPHGARGPGHAAFAMREAEIPDWRKHLAEQAVTITAEIDWPGGGHSIYFNDPAGNVLELATPSLWGFPEEPTLEH